MMFIQRGSSRACDSNAFIVSELELTVRMRRNETRTKENDIKNTFLII